MLALSANRKAQIMKNLMHALFVSSLSLWFCGTAAGGFLLIVTTNTDDGSTGTLRTIVQSATSSDTIIFAGSLSGSTILLTNGQILLANSLTIDASALAKGITLNGNAAGRIFQVNSGYT